MKHVSKLKTLVAAMGLMAISAGAQAALIEQDFHTAGDGLLFLDTATNRQWVDVSHTTGLGGVTGFFSTSIFAGQGFHFATAADVRQVFTDAGAANVLNGDNQTFTANDYAASVLMYSLMEHSSPFSDMGGNPWIHGFIYYNDSTATIARIGDGDVMGRSGTGSFDVGSNGNSWALNDNVSNQVGVWAWRDAVGNDVPEPASLALLGIGLTGLVLSRRKKA